MPNAIPVVLCFDSNYAPYASVATYSAFKNSGSRINFYWIFSSEDALIARRNFENLNNKGIHITLLEVENQRLPAWKESFHITKAAYIRLLIPDLIPEKKAIYLDCDTITLCDLSELYSTDMQAFPIAGVSDRVGGDTCKIPRLKDDIYINSGILLLNLDKLREDLFFENCRKIYERFHESVIWLDQCIINKYAEGCKLILPNAWNTQIHSNQVNKGDWHHLLANGDIKILHFLGRTKPWAGWCNYWVSDLWWKYADQIPHLGIKPLPIQSSSDAYELANALRTSELFGTARGNQKALPIKIRKLTPKPLRNLAEKIYGKLS